MSYDVPAGIRFDAPTGNRLGSEMGNTGASFSILGNRMENSGFKQYGLELRIIDGDIRKQLRIDH